MWHPRFWYQTFTHCKSNKPENACQVFPTSNRPLSVARQLIQWGRHWWIHTLCGADGRLTTHRWPSEPSWEPLTTMWMTSHTHTHLRKQLQSSRQLHYFPTVATKLWFELFWVALWLLVSCSAHASRSLPLLKNSGDLDFGTSPRSLV